MNSKSKIFIVVGTPGSGKDILIQAVNDMGSLHSRIVPKHTTRKRQEEDGNEMICCDDLDYDINNCDITYSNYTDDYGLKSAEIWNGMKDEIIQVIVISNIKAINEIIMKFGPNVRVLFVHSDIDEDQYRQEQLKKGNPSDYINERIKKFSKAINMYYKNFTLFDHVLIYSNSKEDLFDQIFRLFNFYER